MDVYVRNTKMYQFSYKTLVGFNDYVNFLKFTIDNIYIYIIYFLIIFTLIVGGLGFES